MRTPAQMTFDVNALNGNAVNGTHNPVTVAQMEAIYAEARKIEWTDRKPDRPGWWWWRPRNTSLGHAIILFKSADGSLRNWAMGLVEECYGQWSARPIDMPEERS